MLVLLIWSYERAGRNRYRRRRPGWPGRRLLPCPTTPAVRDLGRPGADWRFLAQTLGFTAAVHACVPQRLAWAAVSGPAECPTKDEMADYLGAYASKFD